jgi:predicted enzyme related to lactoylglutathione lyase
MLDPSELNGVKRVKKIRLIAVAALAALVSLACAATQFSIPAVTQTADGARLPGKVIWHDLLSDTPEQTRAFYGGLFGWEFRSLPGGNINYEVIYHRGEAIGGMVDQNRLPAKADISQWVAVFSVTDVEAAADSVRSSGGTVLTPPTSLGERGRIAVVTDSQGAVLALLETADGDPADGDSSPDSGDFLWNELWVASVGKARDFYSAVFPFSSEERSLAEGDSVLEYLVLESAGRPRAGIRTTPGDGLPSSWVSYLRVADQQELDDILSKVEALGGTVVVPATPRSAGGMVAMIAGPSGAGIALQTWPLRQEVAEQEGVQ